MKDEIRDDIEVRFHKDGTVDEIVTYHNGRCSFHMEQMDDHWFWMRFYGITQDLVVHIASSQGNILIDKKWDDSPNESDKYRNHEYDTPELKRQEEIACLINKYGVPLMLQTVAEIYEKGRKADFEQALIDDLKAVKDKFVKGDEEYWLEKRIGKVNNGDTEGGV